MEEMQITSELTWIEVQFARKAVDEVERCRMTLKWTYAMAFYLEKGNEKELFEDNQRYLLDYFSGQAHIFPPSIVISKKPSKTCLSS